MVKIVVEVVVGALRDVVGIGIPLGRAEVPAGRVDVPPGRVDVPVATDVENLKFVLVPCLVPLVV